MPSILMNRGPGNNIIIADNLTDLSSPAVFADKAMRGLSAKQVRLPPSPRARHRLTALQLGLLHDANGVSGAGSPMMIGTQLK
jgi:hypothetical protein